MSMERKLETYREIISTLPRHDGWKNFHNNLCLYNGYWCNPKYVEGTMYAQDHYHPLPSDVIVSSAPKSGTTWLKALTFSIVNRCHSNDDDFSETSLLTKQPHDCVPFIETKLVQSHGGGDQHLDILGTHIPYDTLPKSIITNGCKIVYICREPKDVFVSLWHFARKHTPKDKEAVSLEEAFELFCQGVSIYGPYWDHVLGYWKASLERPQNVLFLTYENVTGDTTFYVKKIAEFIGYPFSATEENEGAVERIIKLTSFDNLRNLEVNKTGRHRRNDQEVENSIFFRKGEIGDWKNHLSLEMAQRLDKITQEKFSGYGITFNV
ncbi:flavonol sulfotransferase-like [Tripterygium wilfordii]|uniref:flavonol sulfotransferase-like n=1 Tax=Tripterygium wilfordii TaxID=458696 RepID=UPI0018F85EE6|nr:flavonol sulfotransferase-like [Tripterygium wilfordii]